MHYHKAQVNLKKTKLLEKVENEEIYNTRNMSGKYKTQSTLCINEKYLYIPLTDLIVQTLYLVYAILIRRFGL